MVLIFDLFVSAENKSCELDSKICLLIYIDNFASFTLCFDISTDGKNCRGEGESKKHAN